MTKLLDEGFLLDDDTFSLVSQETRNECDMGHEYFHEIIHGSEIPNAIVAARNHMMALGFELGTSIEHQSGSIITTVPQHTDPGVKENEAFVIIVMEVTGTISFLSSGKAIILKRGQVIYFDPHVMHGTESTIPGSFASVLRIPVIKK